MMLLRDHLGDLSGAEAVVVGRSNIVGKPMAQLLSASRAPSPSPTPAPATWPRPAAAPTSSSPPWVGPR
jgi:5,10-methylene-tetrahydrofolate dehydrogenase/Methenyl tetrahydrofolate cyclohydrolase